MGTASDYGAPSVETFNDWMVDKTGARWQFWFAIGFVLGLAVTL
jgi:hypothetical protein